MKIKLTVQQHSLFQNQHHVGYWKKYKHGEGWVSYGIRYSREEALLLREEVVKKYPKEFK